MSSRPTLPSPSRTRPRLSRASSPTTPARRTPTASSVTSAARPASPVSVRSVPRPRLRRLPTLRNRGHDLISTTVKVGVDGFAMTAALCQESRAKNGHYLLIELLLSAGREPKKSLVAPHDTTFYAFCCFPCSCVCVLSCPNLDHVHFLTHHSIDLFYISHDAKCRLGSAIISPLDGYKLTQDSLFQTGK